MIPTVCSWSRMCTSERRKLYHTYSMFMFLILCVRKHQKKGNRVIPTLCLCSRFCVSERGKLYHTYIMFIFYILCIGRRETVSYLQYVYILYFVYQKEGNCIIPTVCLCSWFCVYESIRKRETAWCIHCLFSRLCVSDRGKMYHIYNIFIFYRKEGTLYYS